jgi:hypothetical protein
MFIDEDTGARIDADLDASVSHGTHRLQDLIPSFLFVLKHTAEYAQISIPSYALEDDDAEWWIDGADYLLEELWDVLNSYAPYGYAFSAHEGDGSDFGYWKLGEDE